MTIWLWIGFLTFIAAMLAIDLGFFNRKSHVVRAREALAFTGVCVALALLFGVAVYFIYQHDWLGMATKAGHAGGGHGHEAAAQYVTSWLLEYSLSIDNLFVIAAIFSSFGIPAMHQRRVLLWGVIGAIVMRAVMILIGAQLIHRFEWIMYVFGGLLLVSAVRMLTVQEEDVDWNSAFTVRLLRKFAPIAPALDGGKFVTRLESGARALTPLAVVLALVETADLIFAVDSIPAAFSVTQDPFLVFTSNVFAILGLRSLYFALAALMGRFRYLKVSLVFVLAFLGIKMVLKPDVYEIDTGPSLITIVALLAGGIVASVIAEKRERKASAPLGREVEAVAKATLRRGRTIVIMIIGAILVLVGLITMIPLVPGPGALFVLLGLAMLATQFEWARLLLRKTRDKARGALGASAKVVGMENSSIVKGAERMIDEVSDLADPQPPAPPARTGPGADGASAGGEPARSRR